MFIKLSIYYIIILFLSISFSFSENEIFLDKEEKGEIDYDDGHFYYQLILSEPSEEELADATLIFTIDSNKENIEEGKEIFSDPDIYISKTNKKPSGPGDSTYYSEKYGNDILTIPNNDININDTFYIGVYCQYKCRYKLRAYLSKEVELSIGKMTSFTIAKNNSMNFIVNIPDKNYEEFNIYSSGNFISEYKIYMSDSNNPSSQNSFKIIPIWLGTYMFSIRNTDKEYCTNCSYHLIVQNNNKNADLNVKLNAYFQETITEVKKTNVLFDASKKDGKRCYSFKTEKNKNDDKLLINLRLFSGTFNLDIYGFENPMNENAQFDRNYTYLIYNHKIILLEKRDFEKFKNNNYYNENQDTLYFCIRPRLDSSYTINIYYLNDSDKMQRFNILEPNIETLGYLSKNQIISYRYFDNYERNHIKVDTKFIFTDISGENEYYLTYCYGFDCGYKKDIKDYNKDKLITGNYTTYNDYTIEIKKEDNACYKHNENEHQPGDHCRINAIVFCNNSDFCSYKIRLNVENIPLLMSPRKSYFNIIPKNKIDTYEIYVGDNNVTSIVIVLDTLSGDAELSVNKIIDDKKSFVDVSFNDDFLPDVVRITPKKLNSTNVVGNYQVLVSTATFSSYNIYYYTTSYNNNTNNNNTNIEIKSEENIEVTASLTDGQFINDYFPNDIKFKIYKYEPIINNDNENPLFKFVITRIDIKFNFYVFSNLTDIKINTSNNTLNISGYKWSSDFNGELLLTPSSENYTNSGPFYILVYLDNENNVTSQLNNKTVMQYYLGVTTYQTPFNLYEGIQHSLTLNDEYKGQGYWYIHDDIKNDFNFEINILSGVVNVYVDVEKLDGNTIEKKMNDIESNSNNNLSNVEDNENDNVYVNGSFYFIKRVKDFAKLTLNESYFNNYCKKNNNTEEEDSSCPIYIYIRNTRHQIRNKKSSQYILVVHNINNDNNNTNTTTVNEQFIIPGVPTLSSLKVNETRNYYIEELQKRNGSILSVNFENGYGDVFIRIPKTYEKDHIYPNESNYDYKAESGYMGKTIQIPKEEFDRITEDNYKLQILITVKINNVYKIHSNKTEDNQNVKIAITYSNEPIRITQNIPITSYIITGERKYYVLYFDKNTKNIYISLSNMDGDADMYVKKGIGFPTAQDNDWYSTNSNHEHIDIHENDKRFENDTIEGYYSLAIVGFINTKFTLYVSNYEKNVLPLKDNSPVDCYCEKEGEKCYFRFDDVYVKKNKMSESNNSDINGTEIIFTTKYSFGNGIMYAKIFNDIDLVENNDDNNKLYDQFPDEKSYDISNYESNQRNYLNFKIKDNKYQKDSLILLTFICSEETKVSINTAPLRYKSYISYLDVSRENQFYLKYDSNNNDSIFNFYNKQDDDILYTFHSFLGSALISIYYNESIYNKESKNFSYDFKHLDEFVIENGDTVSNYIKNVNGSLNKKTINFKVNLKSDFGFYIKISFNKKWNSLSIGKDNTFLINNNNKFYGYFDILNSYKNIEINVKISNEITKKLKVYIKINYINITEKKADDNEENLFGYNIPSNEINSDFSGVTDDVFGSALINIDKFKKVPDNNKDIIIRALIVIDQFDINNTNIIKNNENDYNNKDTEINILVSPNVNNIQRIDAEPFEYYFNNITEENSYKLYHLTKIDESHSNIIIYLSVCSGFYEYALFDYLPKNEEVNNGNVYFSSMNKLGKDILIIKNANKKHYYLKIWKKEKIIFLKVKLYFMFYYYSSNENLLDNDSNNNNNNNNNELTYFAQKRGQIILSIPKISEISPTGETRKKSDLEYNLFLTYKKDDENDLDSICYLSRYFLQSEENKMFKNIQVSNDRIEIKNLEKDKIAYINILIKNTKTGELITFNHIAVNTKYVFDFKSGNSIFIYIIILILICIIIYLYNKLKKTEAIANYEKNDIGNLTKIELGQHKYERIKYSNLSDTADPI